MKDWIDDQQDGLRLEHDMKMEAFMAGYTYGFADAEKKESEMDELSETDRYAAWCDYSAMGL